MPVSPVHFFFIFLLYQLTGSAASRALKELVGALGGSVTFPLTHSVNSIDSIVWNFNTTTLITIQPKTANNQDTVIVTQNHNKKRVGFPHGNYSLKLSKLNKNDSGVYHVQIYSSSLQHPFTQEYELRVYEHLSQPKIIMGLQNNKNGTCVTNLTCSMEQGGEDVTYSWKSLGQTTNDSHHGSILPISWRLGEKDVTFICMARNPISSNSSNPIFIHKLCEGVAGDLYSTMALKFLWIFLLLSVLVLVTFIFLTWRQNRKVTEYIEEKKIDTHQEILNYYPPSGETSEYDTISNLNELVTSGSPGSDPTKNAHTMAYGITFSSTVRNSHPAGLIPLAYGNTIPEENSVNMVYAVVQLPQKMEKTHSLPASPETPRQFIYKNVI